MNIALKIAWSRRSLALLLLCAGCMTADAQCKPGDILIGEDADNYYCKERAKYEGSEEQRFARTFCNSNRQVAAHQGAIRELGFRTDAERFELYANVARAQKAELQHKLFDALLDQGLDATEQIFRRAKSLNPWNVNNAVNALRDKGYANPLVIAALRRIAAQKDKPAMFAAYKDFVDDVNAIREGWSTGSDMAEDPKNAELLLLLGALKIMQGNPELGLAITAADVGENLVYLAYLSAQVSDLARLSDDKLANLATLAKRLKDHVTAASQAKAAWRRSTGYRNATPTCASER
jgi:hypothetical protein